MRSWLDATFDRITISFQRQWKTFSGRYKTSEAVASDGVRASIAIVGLILIICSSAIAMGASIPGKFRNKLFATPAPLIVDQLPPPAIAGIIADGVAVPTQEFSVVARVAGTIEKVSVGVGETIQEGTLIATVDASEAERNVRNAEVSLDIAELALANIGSKTAPLTEDVEARAEAKASLASRFDNAYASMTRIYLTLPRIVTGLSGILYGNGSSGDDYLMAHADRISSDHEAIDTIRDRAADRYVAAKKEYQTAFDQYHRVSNTADDATLEALLKQSQGAISALVDATQAARDLYEFEKKHFESLKYTLPTVFIEYDEALTMYASQLTDQLSFLNRTIEDIQSARAMAESQAPQPATVSDSDRKAAELEVTLARKRLDDAHRVRGNYEIRAPFSGVVASIEKKKADRVDEGENIAKIITSDTVVQVYLVPSGLDRIKIGQSALVSFENTDIQRQGKVAEIGASMKNEDGFVTSTITIVLENDDRIKPGMKASARFLEN